MTSGGIFPQRLTKIDELTRRDHSYLTPEDNCYFLGEYTARKGYAFSVTNNLISNLKKTVDRRESSEWYWKERAIEQSAAAFRTALDENDLTRLSFVPVPPSKAKNDARYDDRLLRILSTIRPKPPLDIRELVIQTQSTLAVHESDDRLSPEELAAIYEIDRTLLFPVPQEIAIVDDLLTAGAHFKGMQMVLRREFPKLRIIGLFIARRVPETDDVDDPPGWVRVR